MEERSRMIENYIMKISEKTNQQYNGLITEERITKMIETFKSSESSYEEVVAQIDTLVKSIVDNYIEQTRESSSDQLVKTNISSNIVRSYNYHTHTYRSGHGEYSSDKDIVETARTNRIMQLGFSEHIPNPNLVLPDEDHRMLLSEVEEYISSINQLKVENSDMTILVGYEAEFDPMKEAYLGDMKSKVDYMILGQHFVFNGLEKVQAKGNPNYPIEYANMVVKAIESGLFDIVAHPDIFMEYRDTMKDKQARQLFEDNSEIASQIICERARDMRIPIEINYGAILKGQILSDKVAYPNPTFWTIASQIDGLQVIKGIDAHDLKALEELGEPNEFINEIELMVQDKIIVGNYNPVVARQNNKKLQEAYRKKQDKALSFETQMINQMLVGISANIPENIDIYDTALYMQQGLDAMMQGCVVNATKKDKSIVDEISTIPENEVMSINDKKGKIERKKKAIEETNQVLANQQKMIENAKATIKRVVDMGCERKEEIANISTQLTEYNSTDNVIKKDKIKANILKFQRSNGIQGDFVEIKKPTNQLKRTDDNCTSNSNSGFINIITLSLFVTFIVGIGVGIGYMLYKMSIG